jgi:hypothetical protein
VEGVLIGTIDPPPIGSSLLIDPTSGQKGRGHTVCQHALGRTARAKGGLS